jgi:hypothetical protein
MYMILNGQDYRLQPLYVAKEKFTIFEISIRIINNSLLILSQLIF